jgi:hypothetical protein
METTPQPDNPDEGLQETPPETPPDEGGEEGGGGDTGDEPASA